MLIEKLKTLLAILVMFFPLSAAASSDRQFGTSESVSVLRVVTGAGGETAFKELSLRMFGSDGLVRFSDDIPLSRFEFRELVREFETGRRPAESNQILIVLQGILIVEAGSGQSRQIHPGSAIWFTDHIRTRTNGHRLTVGPDSDAFVLVLYVDEQKLPAKYK